MTTTELLQFDLLFQVYNPAQFFSWLILSCALTVDDRLEDEHGKGTTRMAKYIGKRRTKEINIIGALMPAGSLNTS